ncbi:hypothetical protein EYF80_065803 [Liparis tanakae]|uniref:Uncharacterized protein n=1 Tax=Liparis tanakae TaxID=230148 RepID=A0A4Z2E645_9TELE|nr:hypothetical protein EYF80_065803 [Liparis tanakae]
MSGTPLPAALLAHVLLGGCSALASVQNPARSERGANVSQPEPRANTFGLTYEHQTAGAASKGGRVDEDEGEDEGDVSAETLH